jgi:hypothetical protein
MNDETYQQILKEHQALRAALVKVVGGDSPHHLYELHRCLPLLRERLVSGNDLCDAVTVLLDTPPR